MTRRFKRVLIANRGEIAVRIARTLRDMGIEPIAVYSTPDRLCAHVFEAAQAVCIGDGPAVASYLDAAKLVEVAQQTGADAVHPGYGFLSEDAQFAEALAHAGVTLIGPPAQAIRTMGSKTAARAMMQAAGVPCVPGSAGPVEDVEHALRQAEELGYPVMLKAAAGGGGKGMRAVQKPEDLAAAFRSACSEALNSFGDATVYLEKMLLAPHHVEVQIVSDPDGRAMAIGERECSMQRRHQKVLEEAPAPCIDEEVRQRLRAIACQAAEAVHYVGAGTIEFLVTDAGDVYFLEMNTRLQVEHPVTELCAGVDLVGAQVRVAQGQSVAEEMAALQHRGHAIEARVYAEDPANNFMPSPGLVQGLRWPAGPGIRVDSGIYAGFTVPPYYDPLLAKVCVWGRDRAEALRRLERALQDSVVEGIVTNIPYLLEVVRSAAFQSGQYHTATLAGDWCVPATVSAGAELQRDMGIAAAVLQRYGGDRSRVAEQHPESAQGRISAWRHGMPRGWSGA